MVECNTVSAELSNSQLNKLKSAVKNKQGTTRNKEQVLKCLIQTIYLINCYEQQDKQLG